MAFHLRDVCAFIFHLLTVCGDVGSFNYSRDICRKRIVGGQDADKGAYPWHVLITKSGDITCGGSLLNDRWVLTGTCHPLYIAH